VAYNTKAIKKDVDGKPIPQIFDAVKDEYEVLQGRNGAQRIEIYGPDGNPLSATSNKLDVRASELETLLSALGAKDFATQTTLAAILAKIIAAPATEAKQDEIKALLTSIMDTSGIKKITDAVDIGDRAARVLGKITADDGAIAALGALAAAAVTDPTAAGSVVSLLKGVLTDLGQISDATVTAGATGSLSAKIRRLSADINDLLIRIGEVQASPTANTALDRLKTLATVLGTVADAAVTDPAASGSQTALLKGLLKQFQGTGTGVAPVTVTGSYAKGGNGIVLGSRLQTSLGNIAANTTETGQELVQK
jgi:hypothetical protein